MKTYKTICRTLCFGLLAGIVSSPLEAQVGGSYAIRGGTVYTLVGEPIENGTILIRNGRISEVGAQVVVPAGAEIIDATGLEVYPGIMDSVSSLGLAEISSTAATVDTSSAPTVLAMVESPMFDSLALDINKRSNNVGAELLFES